jgi:hypothetical protein
MATFKIWFSPIHLELPKSILSPATFRFRQPWFSQRRYKIESQKKEKSIRIPTPSPTVVSFKKTEKENGVPIFAGFDFISHTFPTSANKIN